MSPPRKDKGGNRSPDPELGDLSERLEDLSGRIAAERKQRAESEAPTVSYAGASGYAQGFRLASEFVAGTLVGGLIGYGVDYLLGTLPFGLIIFLLLGFGAGILNMARASRRMANSEAAAAAKASPPIDDDDDED